MGQHILDGSPPIAIELRQSARARRISLRISGLDGRVTLTVPKRTRTAEALDFAREKESWIRRQLSTRPDRVDVALGVSVLIEGQDVDILQGNGRIVRRTDAGLLVPGDAARVGARVQAFLKTTARERLAECCDFYAARLGRDFSRLTLRDTRSRWGSCTSQGALMFSWRLIMAPPQVLEYVAAHEVAHLAEMNHSTAFWDVVRRIHGPYETPRQWLRQNGEQLHRFRFGD